MANEFMRKHTRDVPDDERVVRVLQHRTVPRSQQVQEVLLLVATYSLDVGIEALFPRPVARSAGGFDQKLPGIDSVFLVLAHLEPRLPTDGFQIALEGVQIHRWASDQLDLGGRLFHERPAPSGAAYAIRQYRETMSRIMESVRAPRGTAISCKGWPQEAAMRMLMNNLDPEVAERPQDLVVYGGSGRAARSWD